METYRKGKIKSKTYRANNELIYRQMAINESDTWKKNGRPVSKISPPPKKKKKNLRHATLLSEKCQPTIEINFDEHCHVFRKSKQKAHV